MFSPITLVPSLYTSSGLRVNSGETSEEFGSWNTIVLCTWVERGSSVQEIQLHLTLHIVRSVFDRHTTYLKSARLWYLPLICCHYRDVNVQLSTEICDTMLCLCTLVCIFFTYIPCILILSKFYYQLIHNWIVLKTILKFALNLALKQFQHVSV
jgi:hypothetical protein